MNVWLRIAKTAKYDYRWSVFCRGVESAVGGIKDGIYDIFSGSCRLVLSLCYLIVFPLLLLIRPILYALLFPKRAQAILEFLDRANKKQDDNEGQS